MGHEMGHYKLYHIQKLLLYLTLMALAGFWIMSWATPRILAQHGERWGVRDIADPRSAPVFWALLALLPAFPPASCSTASSATTRARRTRSGWTRRASPTASP